MTTLQQQNTIKQFVGDGITANFPIPYYVPISDIDGSPAINVYVTPADQEPIPEDDIKIWSVDFIYTPLANPLNGGTLTFLSGKIPAESSIVTGSRNVPAALQVDFADATTFSGETLDDVLLQLVLIEQQNKTYALQRNLSYRVNTFLPDELIEANTQLPLLGENQIWMGAGDGVTAVTLEENPDVSTLRSELENEQPGTDGSNIVGFYDVLGVNQTTVHDQLHFLTSNVRLFGTDTGSVNALVLTLANNTATYVAGMVIKIIPANTSTGAATINLNGIGAANIYRANGVVSQPGDVIQNELLELVYDGTKFRIMNGSSFRSGDFKDFGGSSIPAGFLACDGSAVSRAVYNALFSSIGTAWGVGDGSTTFNLPNSQRKVMVGSGGSGSAVLGNAVGNIGGFETHTQTIDEMPSHHHSWNTGNTTTGTGHATNSSVSATNLVTGDTGGGNPFNILQPSMVVTRLIKI